MQEKNSSAPKPDWPQSYEARREKVRKLNLTSDIFFGKVMEELSACEEFIRILTKEKLTIKKVQVQYSIRNVENRSAILDVLAEDENGKLVNVEIHPQEDEDHVRRVRFYLGCIDVSFLEKGNPFEDLPETYLIYITEKDFIGKNQGIYHVDRILRECGSELDNGVHEMYVNLQAKAKDQRQRELLEYVKCTDRAHETGAFPQVASRVNMLKGQREGEEIMLDVFQEEREEGRIEGRIEGRGEGIKLTKMAIKLFSQGETVDEIAEKLKLPVDLVRQMTE